MNAEYLLDAMGLLDDDLIREAEQYKKPRSNYGPWLAWAASFLVVIALGYGVTHLGMGGGNSVAPNGASGGAAGGDAAASRPPEGDVLSPPGANVGAAAPENQDSNCPSGSVFPDTPEPSEPISGIQLFIADGGRSYVYTCPFDEVSEDGTPTEVPQADTLPEGCRSLGLVEDLGEAKDSTVPHTDTGWYTGCPLWIQGEGWEGPVYLELPEGGYLVFTYSQTNSLPSTP